MARPTKKRADRVAFVSDHYWPLPALPELRAALRDDDWPALLRVARKLSAASKAVRQLIPLDKRDDGRKTQP